MMRGVLVIATVAGALLLMAGMYGVLDILPVFGFMALLIAYVALSRRPSHGRRGKAPGEEARRP
jgi:glycyl-tRNA synthetase alpha subunit